ncbi:PREDICTED: chymotrypsin-2-like [Ceratosolen solmsi marchali]|uniref:Chymotrypsin-2-like n=1 Tax=Ceratosolen solmsi marchali TaxID=326594 RepID=A0AAJ6YWI5_9HYME|nr:PREDICTED: chymotrypsin-2-like [Ceratosolen solmsi marchali]
MKFCLGIYVCIVLNVVANAKDSRIVGGQNANIRDFPYMASIKLAKNIHKLVCGGSIISEYHILTAAHCFINFEKTDLIVFLGNSSAPTASDTEPYYTIEQINVHPNFVGSVEPSTSVHNDIAIAKVGPRILFNEFQKKIELPNVDTRPGSLAVIIGWGRTSYPFGEPAKVLQKALMTIVTNKMCERDLPFSLHSQNICAFQRERVGVCYGDSGGPLVSQGKVIGICSFIRPCAMGEPDVYTRVFSYLDFIQAHISTTN